MIYAVMSADRIMEPGHYLLEDQWAYVECFAHFKWVKDAKAFVAILALAHPGKTHICLNVLTDEIVCSQQNICGND